MWGSGASSLVAEIGRRLVISLGDLRSCQFLRQRIGMVMHRGNYKSVLRTISLPPLREDGFLVGGLISAWFVGFFGLGFLICTLQVVS